MSSRLHADFEFHGNAAGSTTATSPTCAGCCAGPLQGLFQLTTDSEVFNQLIAISLYSTVVDRLIDALKQVIGAYSLAFVPVERGDDGIHPLGMSAC